MEKYVALIGTNCPAEEPLRKHPLVERVIVLPNDKEITSPISSHPDTILAVYNNAVYCSENYYGENRTLLDSIGCEIYPGYEKRSGTYPEDCAFNVLEAGPVLMGRKAFVTRYLKDLVCDTRQGYAACCGLYFMNHVISADESIIRTAKAAGIETIRISGEDITLEGYDCGFVGGAAAALGDTLYLFGNSGKSAEELTVIAKQLGGKVIYTAEGPLRDTGGVKFIRKYLQKAD